ncbi:MAG: UDPGP type 1 family protein [Planctomycetota bacterium]|nr:MAG: UDPGP type 1 family protein [Planctomycetota bacterium]
MSFPVELQRALQARSMESVLLPAQQSADHDRGEALKRLASDLAKVDWDLLDRQRQALGQGAEAPTGRLEAPELKPSSQENCAANDDAIEVGWQALREGRVALATVAGGQASRLGFDGPKGAYPLGSVTGASLFQILAGKVQRLSQRCGRPLTWIIQTGPGNHQSTEHFFAQRNWFGLGRENVELVCQGTLPALSPQGQFLLSEPGALFRNPDGHGGFYAAMQSSGCLDRLKQKGVETLFYCQVDNPLVRMGDPVFLGHHLLAKAQISVKVVEKKDPAEKVGLVVLMDDRTTCIEYSDLPEALAKERAEDGGLRFRAGNIAVHAFSLSFLEAMANQGLPLHLARKQVSALPEPEAGKVSGLEAQPRDGVKFETFVFDALQAADRAVVQLADREEEFAPVKNRSGSDSIATSRQAMNDQLRRWCQQALPGVKLAESGLTELAPGLALDQDDLRRRAGELALDFQNRLLHLAPRS